jgi:hypothetical protein
MACLSVAGLLLTREAGEGDRRRRWRGRVTYAVLRFAPSTMLSMVPLPRRFATEEEPRLHEAAR